MKILLVDDEALIRQAIGEMLQDDGHVVCTSGDGAEALRLILSRTFDLVICDVQLPSLDGLSILKRAREEAPETDFLMITAAAKVPDAVLAVKAGCIDYLAKPFGADELLDRIEELAHCRAARKANAQGAREVPNPDEIVPLAPAVRAFEKGYLIRALEAMGGRRAETAAKLGISRKSLWQKLRRAD